LAHHLGEDVFAEVQRDFNEGLFAAFLSYGMIRLDNSGTRKLPQPAEKIKKIIDIL